MFTARYFTGRYFAPRYFAPAGADPVPRAPSRERYFPMETIHASLGFDQLTGLSSAKSLANGSLGGAPNGTLDLRLTPTGADVRFLANGTAPTSTVGDLIFANTTLTLRRAMSDDDWFSNLKFIEASASATLNIHYIQ